MFERRQMPTIATPVADAGRVGDNAAALRHPAARPLTLKVVRRLL
jgi:hypothetical protein